MAKLDPNFTFENFVVGPANRLASAAARRAAERPGVSYNPLFIHSAPGLGKTHILGAITRHFQRIFPDKDSEYQTAEEFIVEASRVGGEAGERSVPERYRKLDILLLDDVHLLTGEAHVQGILLKTLESFAEEGKQVVLASDRSPVELEGLGAQLRTRFESGLLVDIGSPEYETRVAIIKKWLEVRLQLLEPGVPEAVGRLPLRTVAELDEAVRWLMDLQEKENRTVSAEEVTDLLETHPREAGEFPGSELGNFLNELSASVAKTVEAQEAPWRTVLRNAAEAAEAQGFEAGPLRNRIRQHTPPDDPQRMVQGFQAAVERLMDIRSRLEATGNPWPEAAHGILKDPERLEEAEALLASAEERARSFPDVSPGPNLGELRGELPKLVIHAAEQLVTTDRPEYNPLFIWSRDGMAARALLQASGRSAAASKEDARVALISMDAFAEEFIRALATGVAGAWRERWWLADLLLLDGAQGLSSTERAQEEFFLLLEALQRRRARVMIAADRPPSAIAGLDDRLRARLESGVVVEIEVGQESFSQELRKALQTPAPAPGDDVEDEAQVLLADMEWIRSFQTSGPAAASGEEGPGGAQKAVGAPPRAEGRGESESLLVLSPENVVMVWPRLQDRLVEIPD